MAEGSEWGTGARGLLPDSTSREHGSGSILVIAILAAILSVVSFLVPLTAVVIAKGSVAAAADASALASADVASGLLPGSPCVVAASIAAANRVNIGRCEVLGAVATVTVSRQVLGFRVTISARAGPPGS